MNDPKALRIEAKMLKRKADALDHTPMTPEQWNDFGDLSYPEGGARVLNVWNESFRLLHDRAQLMRCEALYWREKYQELSSENTQDA